MLTSDSYLLDAGWLFLAAWGVIVAVVSVAAFGRDLIPSRARREPAHDADSADAALPPDPAV